VECPLPLGYRPLGSISRNEFYRSLWSIVQGRGCSRSVQSRIVGVPDGSSPGSWVFRRWLGSRRLFSYQLLVQLRVYKVPICLWNVLCPWPVDLLSNSEVVRHWCGYRPKRSMANDLRVLVYRPKRSITKNKYFQIFKPQGSTAQGYWTFYRWYVVENCFVINSWYIYCSPGTNYFYFLQAWHKGMKY